MIDWAGQSTSVVVTVTRDRLVIAEYDVIGDVTTSTYERVGRPGP
jgi:hypothetical protein